jgi:regulatory helix-turn-helix LysR family protein
MQPDCCLTQPLVLACEAGLDRAADPAARLVHSPSAESAGNLSASASRRPTSSRWMGPVAHQPAALSQSIAKLAQTLGMQLPDRSTHGVQLTEASLGS